MNELIAQTTILFNELSVQPMVLIIALPLLAGLLCRCIPAKGGIVAPTISLLTAFYAVFIAWPLFNSGARFRQR